MKKYLLFFIGGFFCTSFLYASGCEVERAVGCVLREDSVQGPTPLKIPGVSTFEHRKSNSRFPSSMSMNDLFARKNGEQNLKKQLGDQSPMAVTDLISGRNSRYASRVSLSDFMHGVECDCQTPSVEQPSPVDNLQNKITVWSRAQTSTLGVQATVEGGSFFVSQEPLSSVVGKVVGACQTPDLEKPSSDRFVRRSFSIESQEAGDYSPGGGLDIDNSPRTFLNHENNLYHGGMPILKLQRSLSASAVSTAGALSITKPITNGSRCLTDTQKEGLAAQLLPITLRRCPTSELKQNARH